MSDLAPLLAGAARFYAALRDRDVSLSDAPTSRDDGAVVIGHDRSGGAYVVAAAGPAFERDGVWLLGSEGERAWLARDARAFLDALGRGCTVEDLLRARAPSGRAMPGVLRWLDATAPTE
ncbi:MAG: hypothetical protein R3A52_27130 [Polyangiales bacterium]